MRSAIVAAPAASLAPRTPLSSLVDDQLIPDPDWDGVVGTIADLDARRRRLVLSTLSGDTLLAQCSPGTELFRDGPATFAEFERGDRVVVRGTTTAGQPLAATVVTPVFGGVNFTADWPLPNEGCAVETSEGEVWISGELVADLFRELGPEKRQSIEFRAVIRAEPSRQRSVASLVGPAAP